MVMTMGMGMAMAMVMAMANIPPYTRIAFVFKGIEVGWMAMEGTDDTELVDALLTVVDGGDGTGLCVP